MAKKPSHIDPIPSLLSTNMIDHAKITTALQAAGLPVTNTYGPTNGGPNDVLINWNEGVTPTAQQIAQAQTIIQNPLYYAVRIPRTLRAIFNQIDNLSNPDKLLIENDILSSNPQIPGNPQKWMLSNQGEVWLAMRHAATIATATTLRTQLRTAAVAFYVRNENPLYLVNPAFAPSINIPGDEVVA